tara:strand:- start:10695 stop:10889 length:195 start_codon:yes stop_codon:yes gene_type:complete
MKNKISHQGIARAAKYAERATEKGENRVQALARGRKLEMHGMLSNDGAVQTAHPDETLSVGLPS